MNQHLHGMVAAAKRGRVFGWRPFASVVATLAVAMAMAPPAAAEATPSAVHGVRMAPFVSKAGWKVRYVTLKHPTPDLAELTRQAAAGTTVPFWTSTIKSPLDGKTYTMSMVGSSPFAATKTNTNVVYVPYIARLHFPGGYVLDPTLAGTCDTESVSTRFYNSPLFFPAVFESNGVFVSTGVTGGTQLASAFQRANFWTSVHGTQYGVTLQRFAAPQVVDITVPSPGFASTQTATCASGLKYVTFGEMDINAYDAVVQSFIRSHTGPSELPILLTYNFVLFDGSTSNCCILGYHSAIGTTAGTRTYSVGSVIDPGIFTNVSDTSVWSHEITEWLDDPFVQAGVVGGGADDATPLWGHIGQVSGCQGNLEVGDPLSGDPLWTETGVAGYIYHFQDLAFHDWFYRTTSTGAGGKYSMKGILTTVQGACT